MSVKPSAEDHSSQLILVVDDDTSDLALISRILIKNGYSVKTAQSAEEALEILTQTVPTIVMSDVGLPGMSGLQLCAAIKSREALRDLPVVFLSGRDSPNDFKAGGQSGGVFYISKHRGIDNLMTAVNALCSARTSSPVAAQNPASSPNTSTGRPVELQSTKKPS
jgi:twitching motility two-component system response regulator PilH